jgi:PAS domain S-box-containing protein
MHHFKSLSPNGDASSIEHRIVLPSGEIRWQHWSDRRIVDETGKTVEYQSVGRDITDKKTDELELVRKNIELEVAYEQIAATEEELRQNYNELAKREQELQVVYEQLKVVEEELRQQYEDVIVVERQLRENEDNFQMMVESAPDAIYISNGEVFLYVNPEMIRLLGANSAADLIGKPLWDRIDPGYRERSRERVHSVIQNHFPVERKTGIYLKLDNSPVYIESSASCIRYKNEIASLVFLREIGDNPIRRNPS